MHTGSTPALTSSIPRKMLLVLSSISIVVLSVVYALMCPYTKVEESFAMQASHDLIYHGWNHSQYDNLVFKGPVPRSFTAPAILTLVGAPLAQIGISKPVIQTIVRITLALILSGSFIEIQSDIYYNVSELAATLFGFIVSSMFHIMFYSSRLLTNTFALLFFNLALGNMIYNTKKHNRHAFFFLCTAALIFRSEISIFIAAFSLHCLLSRKVTILEFVTQGLRAVASILIPSILFDSLFWNRWCWPEFEVWFFNVVQNKSSLWGVLPWSWYFLRAIPKVCITFLPFLLLLRLSFIKRHMNIWLPTLFFVFIYSFLPHKELRFIFYVFPVIALFVAIGVSHFLQSPQNLFFKALIHIAFIAAVFASLVMSFLYLRASMINYPGADALNLVNKEVESGAHVVLTPAAMQTGITRFLLRDDVHYHKYVKFSDDFEQVAVDVINFDVYPELTSEDTFEAFYKNVEYILSAVNEEYEGFEEVRLFEAFSHYNFRDLDFRPFGKAYVALHRRL
ncbi:hypothetical protein PCE1_001307 [Barthelona sp. PCE]